MSHLDPDPEDGQDAPAARPGLRLAAGLILAALALVGFLPLVAHCAEPTPVPVFTQHPYAGAGNLIQGGKNRQFVAARIDARLSLPLGAHLLGRLDATAQRDGAAPEFTDPQTFDVLEGTFAFTRPLALGVGPIVGYGWTVPMEAGRPAVVERYPRRWFAGALVWHPEAWMLAGFGKDEASGQGGRLIFAGQIHVVGKSYFGVDGAVPGMLRSYVLVQISGGER